MSKYNVNNLTTGERILHQTRIHWLHFLRFIKRATTELTITNKRIMGKTGWLKIKAMDSPLNKINNVKIVQGIIGRIFNYGTIIVDTMSGTYSYRNMVNPKEFKKQITEAIECQGNEKMQQQADKFEPAMV